MGTGARLEKQFFHYALPSMASQLLCGFFIVVDGFFIGRNMGDAGLAAVNVAWPLVQVLLAVGMALGIGGSVCMATAMGAGDDEAAGRARGNTLAALCVATVVLGGSMYVLHPYILPYIGADETLMPLACEYLRVVCTLAAFQVFSSGLVPMLRGCGRAMAAMGVMVVGLVSNIVLDWLFIDVFRWGMWGAAVATMTAQAGCVALALPLVLRTRAVRLCRADFRPSRQVLAHICKLGASPFGLSVSLSVILLLNNVQAQRYGGTEAVAIYAILSYVMGTFTPLMSGVGEGVQPLVSYANGARDQLALAHLRRKGFITVVVCGLLCSALCFLWRAQLPVIFGASGATAVDARDAMWSLAAAFPLVGAARFGTSYFYAVSQAKASSLLAYGEPLLVQPVLLLVLPLFFDVQGIWAAYPVCAAVMVAAMALLLRRYVRGQAQGGGAV